MTDLTQYEKGWSPCAIQRKYGLTYAQGYELAERLRKTQELELENKQLKEQINHLLKTQARQFVDNQKLQVKAKKAKDVVNIDTARQIKELKDLLKECQNMIAFKHEVYEEDALIKQIDEALR